MGYKLWGINSPSKYHHTMFAQHWVIYSYLIGIAAAWLLSVPGQFGRHFRRMLDAPPECGISGMKIQYIGIALSWLAVIVYIAMRIKVLYTARNMGSYRAALQYLFTLEEEDEP